MITPAIHFVQVTAISFAPQTLVTLRLGKDDKQQHFVVQQAMLKANFFQSALSGRWVNESTTRVISFPEDDPISWNLYLQFNHCQTLPSYTYSGVTYLARKAAKFTELIRIYCIAEQYISIETKNQIMLRMYDSAWNNDLHDDDDDNDDGFQLDYDVIDYDGGLNGNRFTILPSAEDIALQYSSTPERQQNAREPGLSVGVHLSRSSLRHSRPGISPEHAEGLFDGTDCRTSGEAVIQRSGK
jgi:hypothetical protein